MARLGGRSGKKLLRFVLSVPLAALAILAVYAIANLADGSLASLSAPLEVAVLVSVLAVIVLGRSLLSRKDATERRVEAARSAAAVPDTRAASWPPGKVTANQPGAARAPVAPRMLAAPTMRDPATLPPAISGPIRRAAASAPMTRVANPPTIAARPPVAPPVPQPVRARIPAAAVVPTSIARIPSARLAPGAATAARKTSDVPARPSLEHHGSGSETVTAAHTPGESNALAEYLSGREQLASLIADVEARMPGSASAPDVQAPPVVAVAPAVVPASQVAHETRIEREARIDREERAESTPPAAVARPVVEAPPAPFEPPAAVEPEPEPEIQLEAASASATDADSMLAQNTRALALAIEQVTRASEQIARACDLFADRSEADRAELRGLADAVMTLAQNFGPTPSTPRLVGGSVFATPARSREHEIVIDDDRADTSAPASAPASASSSDDQTRSGSPRPVAAAPRSSNWSAGQVPSTPPVSLQPKPPAPGTRSGN